MEEVLYLCRSAEVAGGQEAVSPFDSTGWPALPASMRRESLLTF